MFKWIGELHCPIRDRKCIFHRCVGASVKKIVKVIVDLNIEGSFATEYNIKDILIYEEVNDKKLIKKIGHIYTLYCNPLRIILPYICLVTKETADEEYDYNITMKMGNKDIIVVKEDKLNEIFKAIMKIFIKSDTLLGRQSNIFLCDIDIQETEILHACEEI